MEIKFIKYIPEDFKQEFKSRKYQPATFRTMNLCRSFNTMYRVMFRAFNSEKDDIYGTDKKWLISQHILGFPEYVLDNIIFPDPNDTYIICPTYGKGGWGNGGDTQIFVTGCIERNETPFDAVVGELKEEIRFTPRDSNCIVQVSDTNATGSDNITWFHCKASQMEYVGVVKKRPTTKAKGKKKVGCIVYGSKKEMIDFITRIEKSTEFNDQIIGLSFIKLDDVYKLIPMIREHKMKGSKYHLMVDFSTI